MHWRLGWKVHDVNWLAIQAHTNFPCSTYGNKTRAVGSTGDAHDQPAEGKPKGAVRRLGKMQPQGYSLQHISAAPASTAAPPKRKMNHPGNPNPDVEVIALSPQALLATNRFVCEVCDKGFKREQNLQLHRRGHNLPWKLKQKNPKEARWRVYLCPVPTCVHHDPSRALGDLTGIKKHYSRKHGEKKLKCDKCNKCYAVESDWKAHSKTCGTREYTCECGKLFFRKDIFITHRELCMLGRESAQMPPIDGSLYVGPRGMSLGLPGGAAQVHGFDDQAGQSSSAAAAAAAPFDNIVPSSSDPTMLRSQASGSSASLFLGGGAPSPAQDFSEDGEHSQGIQGPSLLQGKSPFHGLMQLPEHQQQQQQQQHQHQPRSSNNSNCNPLNLGFFSGNGGGSAGGQEFNSGGGGCNAEHGGVMPSMGSHLSASFPSYQYNSSAAASLLQNSATAQTSATTLLMKAAQMGSTSSTHNGPSALLRAAGFNLASTTTSSYSAAEWASHEAHFHDLIMNSLAGGGGFSGGAGFSAVDDGRLSTRDFLGVGRGAMAPYIGGLEPAQME